MRWKSKHKRKKGVKEKKNWINIHINIFIFMYMDSVLASTYQYPAAGSSTTNGMYVHSPLCMQRKKDMQFNSQRGRFHSTSTPRPHIIFDNVFVFTIHLHGERVPSTQLHTLTRKFKCDIHIYCNSAARTDTLKSLYRFPYAFCCLPYVATHEHDSVAEF